MNDYQIAVESLRLALQEKVDPLERIKVAESFYQFIRNAPHNPEGHEACKSYLISGISE